MYDVVYKGYISEIQPNDLIVKGGFATQEAAENWVNEQGAAITPLSICLHWDESIQCGRKVKAY